MIRIKLILLITVLTLFFINCGRASDTQTTNVNPQPSPTASQGGTPPAPDKFTFARATFSQVCANCHQENAEGGMVKLEGKRIKVPSLRSGGAVKASDQELAQKIADGDGDMPAFKKRFNQDQINELVRYIREDLQGSSK